MSSAIEHNGKTYCTARIGNGFETHIAIVGLFPNPWIPCPAGAKFNGHNPKVHASLTVVTCKDCKTHKAVAAIEDAIEDAKWGVGGEWKPTTETLDQIIARDLKN